jgi:lysophospholipase L1-like esterase
VLCSVISPAQKKIIAVLGSSTAYGYGATPAIPGVKPDSSWANITKRYFQSLGILDTLYNYGNPNTTTYAGMPSDFIPPPNRPKPDSTHNVTIAMSHNPDVVIINFPSNDFGDDFTIKEVMHNFHVMYNTVVSAGKICYITTTQPRDSIFSPAEREQLRICRDSILAEFGIYALDFYDPVSNLSCKCADSLFIKPIYDYDGTHVNNAGHRLFFNVVKTANIFDLSDSGSNPLPVSISGFAASGLPNDEVLISWTASDEDGPTQFELQHSSDGVSFQDMVIQQGSGSSQAEKYEYADSHPATGMNYYRLRITENGLASYSSIIHWLEKGISINKVYLSDPSTLAIEVSVKKSALGEFAVYSVSGELLSSLSSILNAPGTRILITVSQLPEGVYFLRMKTTEGEETRSFVKPY